MNKAIDIRVETSNKLIAIEIAMNPDHEKTNIEKDIEAGCSRVFVGCNDKSVLNFVKKIIESFPDEIKEKVTICPVQKIVDEVKKYLHS